MKLFLFISCFFVIFSACKGTSEKQIAASKYNQEVVNIQKQADSVLINVLSDMETVVPAKFLITYEISRELTYDLHEKLRKIENFNDDKKLKLALIELLNIYCDFYENELSELIDIFLKSPEDINEEDIEFIYNLYDNIKSNYEKAKQDFLSVQKNFAEKWDLELEKP